MSTPVSSSVTSNYSGWSLCVNGLHISLDVGLSLSQEKRSNRKWSSADWVEGQNTWEALAHRDTLLSSEQSKRNQQKNPVKFFKIFFGFVSQNSRKLIFWNICQMKAQVTKCITIIWQMIFLKHNKLVEKLIPNLFWANSFYKANKWFGNETRLSKYALQESNFYCQTYFLKLKSFLISVAFQLLW